MFCMKCGKPTEGEQVLCPHCLAAQQPAQQEIPQQPQPQLDLNLAGDAPAPKPPKKKKKTGAIILSAILVLAILAGVVGFFFFDLGGAVEYTFVKLTKNEKDAAVFVEQKALEENTGIIGGISNALGAAGGSGTMEDTFFETTLSVETGEALADILDQAIPSGDAALSVQQLLKLCENMNLSASVLTDEDLGQLDVNLNLNKKQIITLRAILDLANGEAYAGVPAPEGVSNSYIGIDLEDMGLSMEEITDAYAEAFAMGEKMADMMPAQKELDAMIDKYVLLAVKNIDKVSEDTTTVKADGVSQEVTVYEYTIDEATALKIVRAILKEAEHDDTLYDLVAAFCVYYNDYMETMYAGYDYGYSYYEELDPDALFEQIPDLIEELEEVEPEEDGAVFCLKTYVDATGKICGRALEEKESGTEISMVTVTKGSKKSFEAKVSASGVVAAKLSGTGTEKDGKLTGTYKLNSMGQTFLVIDLESFDMNTGLGTIRLRLGKALQEQLEDAVDAEALSLLGSLDIQLEMTTQKESFELGLLLGGKSLVKLGCTAKEVKAGSIETPDDVVAVHDEFDLQDWVEQVDIAPIVDKLEDAGLPQELADALRELDLSQMMDDALNEDAYYEGPDMATESEYFY